MEKLNELLVVQQEREQPQHQEVDVEPHSHLIKIGTENGAQNGMGNTDADAAIAAEDAVDTVSNAFADEDEEYDEKKRGEAEDMSTATNVTSSLHGHSIEMITGGNIDATDNGDSNVSDMDSDFMDKEADETANYSITSGTAAARDVVVSAEDDIDAAAIIDVQDKLIQEKEKDDHDDFSTDSISIDESRSSNDAMQMQQETGGSDYVNDDASSISVKMTALSDANGKNSEDALPFESGTASPSEREVTDEIQSFTLSNDEGEDENETILVSSEHVPVPDGKDDNEEQSITAQNDEEILRKEGINTEVSDTEGDIDAIGDETKQLFSANDDDSVTNPNIPTNVDNKEANRKFVDGLDELDKLFEPVEVPDELDVGADGTSMQEVLVGQGLKIIWKNVKRLLFSLGGNRNAKYRDRLEDETIWSEEDKEINSSFDLTIQAMKEKHDEGDHTVDNMPMKFGPARGKHKEDKKNHTKERRFLPISVQSPKAKKIWKFAREKFQQAKHILGDLLSIFELGENDEGDEFELFGEMGLVRESVKASRGGDPILSHDIDETFLKTRFQAMKTENANENLSINSS